MDRAYEFIRVRGDNRESADPLFTSGSLPVLPDARQREALATADLMATMIVEF
jgi:hypothetical protein